MPADAADLVALQDGVLTRRQLRRLGFTADHVRAAVAARRWRSVGRHVVVLSNSPLSRRQRLWVAVLSPGKPAALAGSSAAEEAGLDGFEPERVHIVVRHAVHAALPAWVRIHESRRFDVSDVLTSASPPRTRTPRSLIDAATWSRAPRRACAILCAGVQQRLATANQLQQELERAGSIRHVQIMRSILGDISGGGHTLTEIDLGRLAEIAGLPRPRRQAPRAEPDGTVRYLDAEFDLPDGSVLAVEIDGAVHLRPERWWRDTARQNEIVIGGRPMLRYPSVTVRLEPGRVIDQLRRMRLAHTD